MKIAFIIPWYGKDIPGGAESECRKTALHLKEYGLDVEILTTCVKDFHSDWNKNYHKEGADVVEGITVRRFGVKKRDTKRFDAVNYKLIHTDMRGLKVRRLSEPSLPPVSKEDEDIYINEMVNSPTLYEYIAKSHSDYDFFIFIPYMFGTTYFGSLACKDKAVLIPCLHDESYAYMAIYKEVFNRVRGVIFNSRAEQALAERLYGKIINEALIGIGVDTEFNSDGRRFLDKFSIHSPFILYAGRKDPGKNTPLLIDYFCRYRDKNRTSPLKLVLMGSGNVSIPGRYKEYIMNMDFMPAQDKFDAYNAALCLCQPSLNESFSLVMMESWAAGTPALVHAGCEVTRDFCMESSGGLYFSSFAEFAECLDFMMENPQMRKSMGDNGRRFVRERFAWDVITQKVADTLKGWKEDARGSSPVTAQS